MKTLFCIIVLIGGGFIASFLSGFILNIPGALIILAARSLGKWAKNRFAFTIVITLTVIGQSYIYLSFVALVVGWTLAATRRDDVFGALVWPFAFLAIFYPINNTVADALNEAHELGQMNIPTRALRITYVATVISFFIFALAPLVMKTGWRWVPYVSR